MPRPDSHLHPALCFALLGAAWVDNDQPLGSECTLVSSLPRGTASFGVGRAADIQPCIPENEVLRYHFLAKGWDAAQGQVSGLCRIGQTHHISGNSKKLETMILKFLKSVKSVVCGKKSWLRGSVNPGV